MTWKTTKEETRKTNESEKVKRRPETSVRDNPQESQIPVSPAKRKKAGKRIENRKTSARDSPHETSTPTSPAKNQEKNRKKNREPEIWVGKTDPTLVRVSRWLKNRSSFTGYWKFNTSLLVTRNFRDRLKSLIQWSLVEAIVGNRWWSSLKYRIRDFAIKYGQKF